MFIRRYSIEIAALGYQQTVICRRVVPFKAGEMSDYVISIINLSYYDFPVFSRDEMMRLYKMALDYVKDAVPYPATVCKRPNSCY